MRKYFLMLLLLFPTLGFGADQDGIPLHKSARDPEEQTRNEAPVFTAELLTNGSVKVLSSEIATFTVKICNASTGFLLYQGSTINGTLHIAMHPQSTGRYILYIETEEAQYSGVFEI